MTIAMSTQETLGLMKESLTKNVTLATGLTAYDLGAGEESLSDRHAAQEFAAARRPASARRRGALAHDHLDHRLGL